MTQADSAPALRMSLDSDPTRGQGQAADIDATTPLPDGWGFFCSKADPRRKDTEAGYWYATAPYTLSIELRYAKNWTEDLAAKLCQTIDAPTYIALCRKAHEQVRIYNAVVRGIPLRYVPKPLSGVLHWGIWDNTLGEWCALADRFCLIPLEWKTEEEAAAWLYQCTIVWRRDVATAPAGWNSF